MNCSSKKRKEEARQMEIWAHEQREKIMRMRDMMNHAPFVYDRDWAF